jgi:hypothetical protein
MVDSGAPTLPSPPWLVRLREGLFARLPETEEHFTYEGETYVCHRRVDDDGAHLTFYETWLDPQTYRPKRTWRQEIEAGAFAGVLPEAVFQQMVERLVLWLNMARPQTTVIQRRPDFLPHRFAHQHRERRG